MFMIYFRSYAMAKVYSDIQVIPLQSGHKGFQDDFICYLFLYEATSSGV